MRISFPSLPAVRFGNTTPQQPITIKKAQEELVDLLMDDPKYGVKSIGGTGAPGTKLNQCTIISISLKADKYQKPVIEAILKNGGQKLPEPTVPVFNVPLTPVSYKGFPVTLYAAGGKAKPHP
jgi:hypothetical protein